MDARDWLASDEGQAWAAYQRGSQLIEREVDQALRVGADISHSDFQILARLAEAPGQRVRMGALAEMLIAPKSRLNYQIGQLAARGLVAREPHPGDGRGLDAVLTPAGLRQFLKAVPGLLATVRGRLIPLLDDGDLAQLGAIMTRVAEHIEQCGLLTSARAGRWTVPRLAGIAARRCRSSPPRCRARSVRRLGRGRYRAP